MRGMADQGQRATADVDRSTHTHTWDISMKTAPRYMRDVSRPYDVAAVAERGRSNSTTDSGDGRCGYGKKRPSIKNNRR